jgi:serine/tyrosine/threonine adenylyltransferase
VRPFGVRGASHSGIMSTTTPSAMGWHFEHSYADLPAAFHRAVNPTPVREPRMVIFNHALAHDLGLKSELADQPALFTGNETPPGARWLAQAYAGHQYGHFTMLGDGRALLMGEQITPAGQRHDVQLKGPGPTPFSRRGDGRAALGPMLREYIISEAMHALGIPTTRSLAVVATGEPVYREGAQPGAVLTRLAASHIRVGTFEYAAAREVKSDLQALADYTMQRHYPEAKAAEKPYLAFLKAVIERQAALIARWQCVGFIHGVMNTDNMALSGETIDYGPCAFMDWYDPATVFSSIDRHGRYAYGNQAPIARWNLTRFAEALLPLLDDVEQAAVDAANDALDHFQTCFQHHWLSGMRAKCGLFNEEAGDAALIDSLLEWMQQAKADFTNTFRDLSRAETAQWAAEHRMVDWHLRWQSRLQRQPQTVEEVTAHMQAHNPAFIPRNQQVEAALSAAGAGDMLPFHQLLVILTKPFDHTLDAAEYSQPSTMSGYQTFCGT